MVFPQYYTLCSVVAEVQIFSSSSVTQHKDFHEVERFYEDQQDLLELTPKTDVLFITGDWEVKKHLE